MHYTSLHYFNYSVVYSAIRSAIDSVKDLEQLLSPLPFLWFMVGMASGVGASCGIIRGKSDIRSIIISMLDNLAPLFVVFWINRVTQKIADMADKANVQLHQNNIIAMGEKNLLLRELGRLESSELTAMSCFRLDMGFPLNYFGSVLTYAALIAAFTQPEEAREATHTGINVTNETAVSGTHL